MGISFMISPTWRTKRRQSHFIHLNHHGSHLQIQTVKTQLEASCALRSPTKRRELRKSRTRVWWDVAHHVGRWWEWVSTLSPWCVGPWGGAVGAYELGLRLSACSQYTVRDRERGQVVEKAIIWWVLCSVCSLVPMEIMSDADTFWSFLVCTLQTQHHSYHVYIFFHFCSR